MSTAQLYGQVLYLNYADSVGLPLPRTRVYGKTYNSSWTTPWTTTDANGNFSIECPPAWVTGALVEVWSENHDVIVVDTDTARSNHNVPPAAVAAMAIDASTCAAPVTVWVTSPRQAELLHNHVVAIDQSRAIVGLAGTLPKMRAVIKRPYHVSALTGVWGTEKPVGTMADSITFREEDATGTWAQFVVPHEYAHVAHHRNLGGITGFRRVNNCQGHDLIVPNSMGCAAVEGFANFWAVLARWPVPPSGVGGRVHFLYNDLSRNRFLYNGTGSPRDGSRLEGAVASFLLDVVDGIVTDTIADLGSFEDSLQLSPGLVTGVVRDCKIFTYFDLNNIQDNATMRADGIDHWAYCLEQEMRRTEIHAYTIHECGGTSGLACSNYDVSVTWDNSFHPSIPDTYFQERRTGSPTSQSRTPQYPVAWQMGFNPPNSNIPPRPDVRRLWLCNLYGQRCTSRSLAAPFP